MQSSKNVLIEDIPIAQPIINWLTSNNYTVYTEEPPEETHLDYIITTKNPIKLFKKKLGFFKETPRADHLIYWQLDSKSPSKKLLDRLNEVWVLTRTTLNTTTPLRLVPFLLNKLPEIILQDNRIAQLLVVDSKLELHQTMVKTVAQSLDLKYNYFSTTIRKKNWSLSLDQVEHELTKQLNQSAILVELFDTTQKEIFYSDSSNIKKALAHGLPIITTNVCPIWRELEDRQAGIVIKEFFIDELKQAVIDLLENWSLYSDNARDLAEDYIIDKNWVDLSTVPHFSVKSTGVTVE